MQISGPTGSTVSLTLLGAHASRSVDGSTALYPEAMDGVTVEYTSQADQVKEIITLPDAPGRRGVHIDFLVRELGWLTIAKVPAKRRRHRKGQRGGFREPKDSLVEVVDLELRSGGTRKVPLYTVNGALGIAEEINDEGVRVFRRFGRNRTQRFRGTKRWRWYNQYALPEEFMKREITVRLHGDEDDVRRRFNRPRTSGPSPQVIRTSIASTPSALTPSP